LTGATRSHNSSKATDPALSKGDEILQRLYPNEFRSWKTLQEKASASLVTIGFQSAGLGILAGIGGWLGAWLLIVSIAFTWWFILDRIREFTRAVKGRP
jgi:hypothetical protein